MDITIKNRFKFNAFNFIKKRSGPYNGEVTLTRDRVYIVPTKMGLTFSILLLTLLIGSINYEKSLGFILTFLMVGIGNICLLATWRNLAGLQLKRIYAKSIFAGEDACFSVQLVNDQMVQRYSLVISFNKQEYDIVDCAENSNQVTSFRYKTNKRGLIKPGAFKLHTEFPSGLFIAWTWIDLDMSVMVYPKPDKKTVDSYNQNISGGDLDLPGNSIEHFSHLRKYQQGDKLNRVSWKAAAKNDELYTKEFNGARTETLWIDWFEIDARDDEHRLSVMSAYIINAEKNQQQYALKLPGIKLSPALGKRHYHKCMTELALYK